MMHPYRARIVTEMAKAQAYPTGQPERIICERTAWQLQQLVNGIPANDRTDEPPQWFLDQFTHRSAA